MLFDVHIDEVDDVLEIRTEAMKQLKAGGSILTGWASEGTSVTKVQGMSLTKLLEETKAFLQAYDPDLYGRPVKRLNPLYVGY